MDASWMLSVQGALREDELLSWVWFLDFIDVVLSIKHIGCMPILTKKYKKCVLPA